MIKDRFFFDQSALPDYLVQPDAIVCDSGLRKNILEK